MNNIKKEFGIYSGSTSYEEVRIFIMGEDNEQNCFSSVSSTTSKKRKFSSIISEEIEKPFKKLISSYSIISSSFPSTEPASSAISSSFPSTEPASINNEAESASFPSTEPASINNEADSASFPSTEPVSANIEPITEKVKEKEPINVPENISNSSSLSDYVKCEKHRKHKESCFRCHTFEMLSRELVKDGIILQEMIGKGGYGTVFKGSFKNQWVAIKVFFRENAIDDYENEMKYLQLVESHLNIIEYKFAKKYGNIGVIVFELMDQSLYGYMKENQMYFKDDNNRENLNKVVKGMAFGLEALHEKNIVHVDFHPGNVLMDKVNFNVKITDFGLSKIQDEEDSIKGNCALIVRPPEAGFRPNGREHHKKYSDIYQFGLIMQNLVLEKDDAIGELPTEYQKLYIRCMNRIPSRRPSIQDIVKIVSKW